VSTAEAVPRPGLGERLRRWLLEPEYPHAAVEVRPRSVGAVRMSREQGRFQLAAAASLSLPEGAVALSMVQPNVQNAEVFRETVRSLLERAGIPPSGIIGLVLPDPVARVTVLPVADIAGKDAAEAEDVVRFRLRKAVPFDIKDARLALVLPPREATEGSVVAVAIARPVLEGYEDALRSLGLQPGLVELAGLSIVGAVEAMRPPGDRLIVNWDEAYVSLILARRGQVVLARTLTGESVSEHEDVVREVANTVLFYREKLGGPGLEAAVVRAGSLPPDEAIALLQEPIGLVPEVLALWPGAETLEARPQAQAVAGAAACVVGRFV
jgi:hypothetical protein